MCAFIVVDGDPLVKIGLKLLQSRVDLLAERDLVELLFHCPMESLTDAVRLRAIRFGPGMPDVVDCQE